MDVSGYHKRIFAGMVGTKAKFQKTEEWMGGERLRVCICAVQRRRACPIVWTDLSASWFAGHGQISLLIYHLSLMYFDFQKDISGKAIT